MSQPTFFVTATRKCILCLTSLIANNWKKRKRNCHFFSFSLGRLQKAIRNTQIRVSYFFAIEWQLCMRILKNTIKGSVRVRDQCNGPWRERERENSLGPFSTLSRSEEKESRRLFRREPLTGSESITAKCSLKLCPDLSREKLLLLPPLACFFSSIFLHPTTPDGCKSIIVLEPVGLLLRGRRKPKSADRPTDRPQTNE